MTAKQHRVMPEQRIRPFEKKQQRKDILFCGRILRHCLSVIYSNPYACRRQKRQVPQIKDPDGQDGVPQILPGGDTPDPSIFY